MEKILKYRVGNPKQIGLMSIVLRNLEKLFQFKGLEVMSEIIEYKIFGVFIDQNKLQKPYKRKFAIH